MAEELIHELMIVLSAGLVAALVCRSLNISVLIGYVLVGALVGHGVLGFLDDENHHLGHLAEVGVFLLLFSIGLEFSVDDLKKLGRRFVVGGGAQMLFVAAPVTIALLVVGYAWQPALLVGAAIAFSSTVLVFRGLAERGHSQEPHGQRAIGILLFQDAALVPLLLLVPMLKGDTASVGASQYIQTGLTSFAFVVAVIGVRHVLAEWVIPAFAAFRSAELVILFTVVSLSGVTLAAYSLGLPPAVGAFAAGLIFNGNRWSHQIDALVLPFRETFAAVFFVGLGLILDPIIFIAEPIVLAMLVGVIVLKATAATIALRLTGLDLKASTGMGLGLAHIGEFALVLALMGVESGVLIESDYQRLVAIAVGSLLFSPLLLRLGLKWTTMDVVAPVRRQTAPAASGGRRAVVIGAGPVGSRVASNLHANGHEVSLIDFSPINLQPFAQQGMSTVAGDALETSTLESAGVPNAEMIVVSLPCDDTALQVVTQVAAVHPKSRVVVRCRYDQKVRRLMRAGATEVIADESLAAESLAKLSTLEHFQPERESTETQAEEEPENDDFDSRHPRS